MNNEFDMDYSIISDMHKDAYGFRPRSEGYWSRLTTAEAIRAEMDRLQVAVEAAIAEERAREDAAVADFEAAVARVIDAGAGDRETAVRWMMEAQVEMDEYDAAGYFEYLNGLPMGYMGVAA